MSPSSRASSNDPSRRYPQTGATQDDSGWGGADMADLRGASASGPWVSTIPHRIGSLAHAYSATHPSTSAMSPQDYQSGRQYTYQTVQSHVSVPYSPGDSSPGNGASRGSHPSVGFYASAPGTDEYYREPSPFTPTQSSSYSNSTQGTPFTPSRTGSSASGRWSVTTTPSSYNVRYSGIGATDGNVPSPLDGRSTSYPDHAGFFGSDKAHEGHGAGGDSADPTGFEGLPPTIEPTAAARYQTTYGSEAGRGSRPCTPDDTPSGFTSSFSTDYSTEVQAESTKSYDSDSGESAIAKTERKEKSDRHARSDENAESKTKSKGNSGNEKKKEQGGGTKKQHGRDKTRSKKHQRMARPQDPAGLATYTDDRAEAYSSLGQEDARSRKGEALRTKIASLGQQSLPTIYEPAGRERGQGRDDKHDHGGYPGGGWPGPDGAPAQQGEPGGREGERREADRGQNRGHDKARSGDKATDGHKKGHRSSRSGDHKSSSSSSRRN